jgi:hypothetical protein
MPMLISLYNCSSYDEGTMKLKIASIILAVANLMIWTVVFTAYG